MSLLTPDASPGRPFWWGDVTWPTLEKTLPDKADLLVVGAGYTGLSAAISAHDAGARVVVIDSGLPGQGASARNGGMVGAHPRVGWDTLAGRHGPQVADVLYAEAGEALDWVKSMIAAEAIDCDFEETGRIQLAYTSRHFAAQKALAAQVSEKGGGPCHLLTRDAVRKEIATPLYKGAILFPNHGGLHPAKYLLGLLKAAQRRGIPVLADCPAVGMTRIGGAHQVATPLGPVTADKVVLATNGHTGGQFPWHHRRVFPVPSFLIATEPLSPDRVSALAPGRRMMVETRAFHCYYRISPDGTRLIFGGRASLVNIDLATATRRLRRKMVQVWPSLRDVRLSHVWTGNTGFAFNHMPHVGEADGIHHAMGYSGGGTVLAPWLGRKAALRALGMAAGDTAFTEPGLTSRWFYRGGQPRFLLPADLWYRHWIDRREDRAARR